MIEDLGHTAITAETGQQALALVRGGARTDLVITDYSMPGMTGLQLAEELRRLRPELPIVLATGYGELREASFDELLYLPKPFSQAALAQSIEKSLHLKM